MNESIDREKLLAQATKAPNLQELADLAYLILGNPIFIEDRSCVVLAYSNNVSIDSPEWNYDIKRSSKKSPKIKQIHDMEQNYSDAFESGSAIITNDGHLPYLRIIKPLLISQWHVGTMVCAGYCAPIKETDKDLIDILAVIAVSLMRDSQYQYMISSKRDTIDNFLIRLLMGFQVASHDVRDYVETIRWSSRQYHYIMVLCPLELEDGSAMPLYDILEDARSQANCHALIFDSRIICICNMEKPVDSWDHTFPILTNVIQKYRLYAGISQSFENPSLINTYYHQAKSTAEIAGILKNQSLFYCYNDISIYHLFNMLPPNTDLRQFCNEKILALENYDTEHNAELVPTLHAYLESRCSVSKTASRLFVHRNTVNYRIRKCFEILNSDLESGDDFFSCVFSLRILEYANKRIGKMPSHYFSSHPE